MSNAILTIVGARPNFMKAAPIHHAFASLSVAHEIVHTGQHYDDAMSKVFFDDLQMPKPSVYLGVGSGSHATQTAAVMVGLEKVFEERKPRMVNVVGDVNSTLAAAIVAVKMGIPVAHTEAGLRSGDFDMPEEVNRSVTDAVSHLLLTPSADADANLRREGRDPAIIVRVGNVMIDTLFMNLPKAKSLDMPAKLGVEHGRYAVLTLHRPSNVDVPATFARLLGAVLDLQADIPIVFPVHPRTRKRMKEFAIGERLESAPNVRLVDPLGYLEFMSLTTRAKFVLTDSGGLQEETTALGIPCLTLRESTERPVTVDEGTNVVVGTDDAKIRLEARNILEGRGKRGGVPALWDGKASARIAKAILEFLEKPRGDRLGAGGSSND